MSGNVVDIVVRSKDQTAGGFGSAHAGFKKLAGAVAAIGIGKLIKDSIGLEAQFGQTMATLQAATGTSTDDMKKLNDMALKLGADTSFSANEAADAMLELAKAGIKTKDIMGGGVAGTLTLAAAGGTDLATAATIAANAMNTFGLKGKDMESIAAALAGGANASTASVESLGMALRQVGPGATNAGLSLQETVGALAAFDNAGIKGSDAGTSLKTMLARLVPTTEKASKEMAHLGLNFTDAHGNFKSITDIAEQLHDKMGKLSESERTASLSIMFGSDATRAATVLMNDGAKGLGKFIKATKDQNAAQEMAKARMAGTAGALERLKGSVETAQLKIGQALAPAVQAVSNALAQKLVPATDAVIQVFATVIGLIQDHTTAAAILAAGIAALVVVTQVHAAVMAVSAAGGMAAWLKGTKLISAATKVWAAVQWVMNAAMSANPIALVVIAIAALVAGVVIAYKKSETFRGIINGLFEAIKPFGVFIGKVFVGYLKLLASGWLMVGEYGIKAFRLLLTAAFAAFGGILDAAAAGLGWIPGMGGKIKSARDAFEEFGDKTIAKLKGVEDSLHKTRDAINGIKSKTITITVLQRGNGLGLAGGGGHEAPTPGLAHGGISGAHASRMAMVGERGRELVRLPVGSQVIPNGQTERMLGAGGGRGGSSDRLEALIESLTAVLARLGENVRQGAAEGAHAGTEGRMRGMSQASYLLTGGGL